MIQKIIQIIVNWWVENVGTWEDIKKGFQSDDDDPLSRGVVV